MDILGGRYEIQDEIGSGAMGVVYRAVDRDSGREVAVKVLPHALARDPQYLARFEREASALRDLNHPNIVPFIDSFEEDSEYYLIMEFMPGGSLYDRMRAQGALPVDEARQIAIDIADALIRAHRLDIIHRDLKPENVLFDAEGTPRLADFGVAGMTAPGEGTRLTGTGTQMGTPYYMSPEAWQGQRLDAQSDVWSLGVLLFEMLSSELPFKGETAIAVMREVLQAPTPDIRQIREDIPDGIYEIIRKALAKDKSQRYANVRAMSADLEAGAAAIPLHGSGMVLDSSRRGGLLVAGVVGLLVIVAAVIAFFVLGGGGNGEVAALPTSTESPTPQPSLTDMASITPTRTETPSASEVPTLTDREAAQATLDRESTIAAEFTSIAVENEQTAQAILSATASAWTDTPTNTSTPTPTATFTETPTPTPTATETVEPTQAPSEVALADAATSENRTYVEGDVLFEDDFEIGNFSQWYLDSVNSWNIVEVEAGNHVAQFVNTTGDYAHGGGARFSLPWVNYVVEASIRIQEPGMSPTLQIYSRSTVPPTAEGCQIYSLSISPSYLRLDTQGTSACQTMLAEKSYVFGQDVWHSVRFELIDNQLKVFVDDELVLFAEDNKLISGNTGLIFGPDAIVEFDDMRVVELVPSPFEPDTVSEAPSDIAPVTRNADWTPVIEDFDGVEMVLVPPGCFMMGSEDGSDDEKPVHEQCFDQPFWIDTTEVTRADYARLGNLESDAPDFLAAHLPTENTWAAARDYCTLRGGRLPTEREWEYAARGPDSLVYPWGNYFIAANVIYSANSNNSVGSVGSKPAGASWVGALDMIGNVWEWVSSIYANYPYVSDDGREVAEITPGDRVVRGGGWEVSQNFLYVANRSKARFDAGFRCARDFDASTTSTPSGDEVGAASSEIAPVTRNADWTPVIEDFDGVEMVLVPPGCFMMGSDESVQGNVPPHEQCFENPFWIDHTEVTNEQYGSTVCTDTSSQPDQPRNCVGYVEARSHCESRGGRLPTEAEWEYAARGPDSLQFPWGDEYIPDNAVYEGNANIQTAPVGSKPAGASWVGALDMAGNLFEFTSTVYGYSYPYVLDDGREDQSDTTLDRVVRGASFDWLNITVVDRYRFGGGGIYFGQTGFRCVKDFE